MPPEWHPRLFDSEQGSATGRAAAPAWDYSSVDARDGGCPCSRFRTGMRHRVRIVAVPGGFPDGSGQSRGGDFLVATSVATTAGIRRLSHGTDTGRPAQCE